MIVKTEGIVLHSIKYAETSVIAYIYTVHRGRQSYLINGIRKKKSKIKMNVFQPLSLLSMEVYHKQSRDLQRIKEIQLLHPFSTIPFDLKKNTVAQFLAEILYKTLKEEEENLNLFGFLTNSIRYFDLHDEGIADFHIYFMLQLTKFLGFFPDNNYSGTHRFFDMKNGNFCPSRDKNFILTEKVSKWIHVFLSSKLHEIVAIQSNHLIRAEILENIIEYYSLHIDSLGDIKSLAILKDVFH